jgi:hypothetical protein
MWEGDARKPTGRRESRVVADLQLFIQQLRVLLNGLSRLHAEHCLPHFVPLSITCSPGRPTHWGTTSFSYRPAPNWMPTNVGKRASSASCQNHKRSEIPCPVLRPPGPGHAVPFDLIGGTDRRAPGAEMPESDDLDPPG